MLSFYSTNNHSLKVTLKEAVLCGQAPDGGLLMPDKTPQLDPALLKDFSNLSLTEISCEIAKTWLDHETISFSDLKKIVEKSISFDAPIIRLTGDIAVLELFHGPTLSFKDFGARFMARLIEHYNSSEEKDLHILVATSGDTGSAVAQAFLDIPAIQVIILYPKGKISTIQEKQLTTVGHNVTALEIEGTFDDCQDLVKKAFRDPELRKSKRLTSANSINIARIIPQTFYYFYAFSRLKESPFVVSIPCGNYGNLTAALFAKKMGLPIERIVAATNINDAFPKYLKTGVFIPQPSQPTLSNAIDIGNPNNFKRIENLFGGAFQEVQRAIYGISFTDQQTTQAIQELYRSNHYLMDPHGAVAYLGLLSYQKNCRNTQGVFLETAHPAKFQDVVEPLVGKKINMPQSLKKTLAKEKCALLLPNNYEKFKEYLLS